MAYIRKVKTKSGATAVQIAHKVSGKLVKLEHLGSAHNPKELETLPTFSKLTKFLFSKSKQTDITTYPSFNRGTEMSTMKTSCISVKQNPVIPFVSRSGKNFLVGL